MAEQEMTPKQLKRQLDKYKRLYNSAGKGIKRMEQAVADLSVQLKTTQANLGNCQQALDLQKTLLRQTAAEQAKKEAGLVDLLTKLKAKLRELGYNGNFDNMGHKGN